MTQKIVKTARGRELDLGKLELQNEDVTPIGNLKTAKTSSNKKPTTKNIQPVASGKRKSAQVSKPTVSKVFDAPVTTSTSAAKEIAAEYKKKSVTNIEKTIAPELIEDIVRDLTSGTIQKPTPNKPPINTPTKTPASQPSGGIAGAIAKVQEVKQEPDKSPRDQQRSGTGVKRI